MNTPTPLVDRLAALPRVPLGFWPTPLTKAARLTEQLGGPEIWIKRDDQSGLALGGNKVRKLERLIGEAIAQGADTLVTGGAEQSNHCRQTAAAAAMCGLDCHLALGGTPPDARNGNLLLDGLLGATIHWCGPDRKGERMPEIADSLRSAGKRPEIIPYGGSNVRGAVGFVDAAIELSDQLAASDERFTHIIIPSSSGGTQAGLAVGLALAGSDAELIGIAIDKGASGEVPLRDHIVALIEETSELLGADLGDMPQRVDLRQGYVGGGYGVVGQLERRAIQLAACAEGLLLDPVYTGRAFGAMVDMIERGEFRKTDRLLFWHTGGIPALFSYSGELLASSE